MKYKKIIVMLIIVLIIICTIVLVLIKILEKKDDENREELGYVPENTELLKKEYKIEKLRNLTDFFSVETCIQNNIDSTFEAKDMNVLESERIYSYSVYGKIKNTETGETADKYFIVRVDTVALAFELQELNSEEYNNIDEIDLTTDLKEITQTENNKFEYTRISNEKACRIYLQMYIELLLSDPETAYGMLEEQYKQERFSSYENFLEYIEENRTCFENAVLSEYSVNYSEEYTEFMIVDTYNNNYLVRAKSVMDYTIQLDSYTIKDEEYQEEYSKLSDLEKASINIDIFIRMLNTKDYSHAYEVLSDGFKSNYFSTEEQFKNYVKENFFDYNIATINRNTNEGEIYIYDVNLRSGAGSAAETLEKTFNVSLEEGTDFKISFNV